MKYRLEVNEGTSLKFLDTVLLPQIREVEAYSIDLSGLKFLGSPDAVNLLLFIGYLGKISKSQLELTPPSRPDVVSFLSNMRFFVLAESLCFINKVRPIPQAAEPQQMAKRDILEIKHIPIIKTLEGYENWLGINTPKAIIDKLNKLQRGRGDSTLGQVFFELSKNIFEHSKSFGYVAAQVDRELSLHITIGDLGIGIFESLQVYHDWQADFDEKFGPLWDEAKALDIAFAPAVSRKTAKENQLGGAGLYSVLRIVKESKGRLICRSGRTKVFLGYLHNKWETERRSNLTFFPGTQLEVTIPG